jgi:hypothetical protein
MEFKSYHPLPKDCNEFLATLNQQEREVQQLAADMLKSSYFMEKTHAYRKWNQKKKASITK